VFTPLKYLYGLHDSIFAETLKASDYAHLANDSSIPQTIFAPVDKAYPDFFEAEELLRQVRYNFVEKQIVLPDDEGEYLFETMYTLASLDGAPQMVKLSKRGGKYLLNNEVEIIPKKGTTPIQHSHPRFGFIFHVGINRRQLNRARRSFTSLPENYLLRAR
jgi:hypothetical protein